MSNIQHMVSTQQTQPYCFKWTIEKYEAIVAENKYISSQEFTTTGGPEPREWEIVLWPNGDRKGNRGHVSLYLQYFRDEDSTDRVTATLKFTIKSATNQDYSSPQFLRVFGKKITSLSWGIGQFISVKELAKRAADLLPNGTLTVVCEGEVFLERKYEEVEVSAAVNGPGLSEDVRKTLTSDLTMDVTLVVNGSAFPVHKYLLCARSPVFAAMFEHETEEKMTGKVIIKDFSPEVVRGLVHFMYSDQTPEDMQVEVAMELLAAADKYQILRLKSLCELHLTKCLTLETVFGVLDLAMMHNSSRLKEACVQFVKYNM